ncbi:epithelial-stromal interaction protein 1-like isoform X2 [Rhinatrema bivittatum]|uniref:epithelial-stromal interaction protein 1-like isoform X2 n=1 Tax=Rhinatrema bivittatum TaxID=194408 RepID=UPI00112877FB|nr:epithelial-stromal interaction protein 1-like isoform X2 [Rhinatrema bivittatum]
MYKGTGGHSRASVGGDRGRLQQRPGQALVKDRDPSQDCPTEPAEAQQPQCASGYVLIPANETRRNQIQRIAREELENLERWKEQHRPGPIHLTPKKLGGIETEASARQKQQNNLKQSKYQQKFKRDDYRRKMKEEEEAEILKMKAIQREKANRLEAMQKQQKIQKKKSLKKTNMWGIMTF